MLAAIAEAVTGPKPGMVIKRRAPFVASSHRGDSSIAARDLLVQNMQLPHQRGECRAHAGRNRPVAFCFDDPRQVTGVFEPPRPR